MAGNPQKKLSGACMCGSVAFETGEPRSIFHCHCESCRRSTGQAATTFVSLLAGDVTFSGVERHVYNSSPGVSRTFCPNCGTPLAWEGTGKDGTAFVEIYIANFADRDQLLPTHHVYYEERVRWFDIADGLPRYRGTNPKEAAIAHGPAREGLPG